MSEENKETIVEETEVKEEETKDEETSEKLELTQAEINEMIAKRLARERSKYADYDELKTKLTEFEKAEEERKKAEMSEVERLQAELEAKQKAEEELAKQIAEYEQAEQQRKFKEAFISAAKAHEIEYPDAALKLADTSDLELGNDGTIEGIDALLNELVTNYEFLKKPKETNPKKIGGSDLQTDTPAEKSAEQRIAEAEAIARKSGRMEDRIKVAQLKRELGQ